LVSTTLSSPYIVAQAFITKDGTHKLLLVNKRDRPLELQIPGAAGGRETHVGLKSASSASIGSPLATDTLGLGGFSVTVLTFPH
jgi:hypothetical protein